MTYSATQDDDGSEDLGLEVLGEGNGGPLKQEANVEERFEAAVKTIIQKKKLSNVSQVDEFFDQYGDVAHLPWPKTFGNLLHRLVLVVIHNDITPKDIGLLVERLVQRHPDLLKGQNKDGCNPIFMAIKELRPHLVEYMVSACTGDDANAKHKVCLNAALEMKDPEGKTCLHLALRAKIKEKINPEIAKMLIRHASDGALAIQDNYGRTPMHYALLFGRCTDEDKPAEFLTIFLERDLNARLMKPVYEKTFLDLFDRNDCSVYQQHQKSRINGLKLLDEKLAALAEDETKQGQGDTSRSSEKSSLREPKAMTSAKDSRYAASAKPPGSRGMEKQSRDNEGTVELDPRERLRQEKKAEEERKAEYKRRAPEELPVKSTVAEPSSKRLPPKELVVFNRDEIDNLPTKVIYSDENTLKSPTITSVSGRQLEPAPNTSKRRNTAPIDSRMEQEKSSLGKLIQKFKDFKAVSLRNSNDILERLKLHYMRTRNAEMIISFLYGTNMDDIQISFDYDRLPRQMSWKKFTDEFGKDSNSGLKFDPVLKYVTFPFVKVELVGRQARLKQGAKLKSEVQDSGATEREDMTHFFGWLYDKGVRHIMRLTVQDPNKLSEAHSDKAIQVSLERFIVEHLDWQKMDLDPETILRVSSRVMTKNDTAPDILDVRPPTSSSPLKALCLRWSGRNAVLRAWSELEGLPLLPQLREIHIYKPPLDQTCDSSDWIDDKIEKFRKRLNSNRKTIHDQKATAPNGQHVSDVGTVFEDVNVIPRDMEINAETGEYSHDHPPVDPTPASKGIDSHRWLKTTARFAGAMDLFWKDTIKRFEASRPNRNTREPAEGDVVLALIDDGVDMFDTPFSKQILEGKTFDFHNEKLRPPFSSARGHGTVMASMILSVCPMAKVYPIRLQTWDDENGKNNIGEGYAAQAIQAALDKNATIISMSWTIPMKNNKADPESRLHKVLEKAVQKRVLMFCSAPDTGQYSEFDYPSGPWRDKLNFFRIGAAYANGAMFEWTPTSGITYILPGVDVIKRHVGGTSQTTRGFTTRLVDFKYETGSSVATALAAGLAAILIYCVKASILLIKTVNRNTGPIVGIAIPDNGADLIANPDVMNRAFATLGYVTPNKFIQVWDELDKVSTVLEAISLLDSDSEERLEQSKGFLEFGRKLANCISQ